MPPDATTAPTDAPKPDATATPASAASSTPAPAAAATPAPVAADPKATGTAPAPTATPAPADAGEDVDDGDDSILEIEDDDDSGEPAKGEGDKPAEGEGEKTEEPAKAPKPTATWVKERDAAADAYIAKIEKKLSTGKDGKPLSARQKTAAIDDAREKFLAKLSRYPSMTAALIAGINAQDKISSGKYKAPLTEDATDEEIAAWRKENGIPDDAKGYKLPKVQGDEWTEADKPGVDRLLARLHEKNASQAQVDATLTTYKELVAEAKQAQVERLRTIDRADAQETQEFLRKEFEDSYKDTMTVFKRLFKDQEVFPDGAGHVLAEARDPATGQRLIHNPVIAKFFADYARNHYGDGNFITGDQQAAANTEEQELINLMNTDIDAYNYKPWKTTGMTASERLLEINRKKEASGRGRRAA
jgi:predicted transcriptional regulator